MFLVSKLILFLLCSREQSATLNALAQDHRNDVFSNTVALICGTVGMRFLPAIHLESTSIFFFKGFLAKKDPKRFPTYLVLADSIGAILISIYILTTWIRQANRTFVKQLLFIEVKFSSLFRTNQTIIWLYCQARISSTDNMDCFSSFAIDLENRYCSSILFWNAFSC